MPTCFALPFMSLVERPAAAFLRRPTAGSDHLYAASLGSLLSLDDLELDFRALLQDGAPRVVGVNKHVLPAAIRRDETETLGRVKKLYRTCLHLFVPALFSSRKWEA